jgi:beta-1,2-N-acetylglucosaminyltransferase
MSILLIRPLRRLVTKKCGGYRRLLLLVLSVVLAAYTLRSFLLGDGRQIWDAKAVSGNMSSPCDVTCPPDQLSFYIRTGEKTQLAGYAPLICFQGTVIMSTEQNNVGRGLNVVLVDSTTLNVKMVSVFDTYLDDASLLRFLKKYANDEDILMVATYDDASYGLKESGRQWLKLFGSSLIDQLGFRENFIMIGHRGLVTGSAIEYRVTKRDKADSFAPSIEKAGCFSFPLGDKVSMDNTMPDVLRAADMKRGARLEHCGLEQACPHGSVAVAVDTGHGNQRQPSICVGDFVRMDGATNDAGRGFNVVILDQETLEPTRLSHLDTYTFDSTDLELMLESLHAHEIVIAVIADDASKKLGQSARDLLNKLGSGHIQNLRFRDVWYFVGQKGIDGFTQLEQLSFAAFDGGWPKPLTTKFCVPKIVPTSQIMIEPEGRRNDQRRQFCTKFEGYIDFCNPANVDDELKAIEVASKDLKGHGIFDLPVVIVPGMNHNAFVHTLQTTLMQPGIKLHNVAVFWDEKLPEYGELAAMFGFNNHTLDSSVSYSEQMIKAIKLSRVLYPTAEHVMVIEEDLLLAPDFMPFMAQCLGVVKSDPFLAGASAWNINGFEDASGNETLVYRVQELPGLGFLMKSEILDILVNAWETCCQNRAWLGWVLNDHSLEMLMPDVSRVYRTPFYGAEATSDLARHLFIRPRRTYLNVEPSKLDLQAIATGQYDTFVRGQILIGQTVPPEELGPCLQGQPSTPDFSKFHNRGPLVVYLNQQNSTDMELMVKVCHCFGLVVLETGQPKNLHNGLLRFFYQEHDVFLVGSMTGYFNTQANITDILS